MAEELNLRKMLHENRAAVKARGHDWDVADVMAVFYDYLQWIDEQNKGHDKGQK